MASPQGSVTFYVQAYSAATLIVIGNLVMPISGTDGWVVATAAARGTTRCSGFSVAVTNGSGFGTVEIWQGGSIDPTLTGLGTGTASWVRCSSAGIAERFTPVNAGSSDVIGWCETDGRLHLLFGVLTETIAAITALPSGLVAGDILYVNGSNVLSRLPKGIDGQVLTLASGLPSWATPASSAFDISSLSLSAWWRAGSSYNAATGVWGGTGSNGSSGSRSASSPANKPTAGAALNGLATVAFARASSQYLQGLAISNYLSSTGYSGWVLMKSNGASASNVNPNLTDCFLSDNANGGFALGESTSGPTITLQHDDGTQKRATATYATGAWQLVMFRWTLGTGISVRVNSGSWSTPVAATALAATATLLNICSNYNQTGYVDGLCADIGLLPSAFGDVTADSIKARLNLDYALSL